MACKKIFKVFRGIIENPNSEWINEVDEDFSSIGFKNVAAFLFSEI